MNNKYQEAYNTIFDDLLPIPELSGGDKQLLFKSMDILQELVDKETPMKPITIKPEGNSIWDYPTDRIKCANCGNQLPMKKNCLKKKVPIMYCDRCGQKLDWGDE